MKKLIFLTSIAFLALIMANGQKTQAATANIFPLTQVQLLKPFNVPNFLSEKTTDEFDVSTNWSPPEYFSDLNVPVNRIFRTDQVRPDTNIHYATVNFANIGNARFRSSRVLHLKGNKTYHLKFLYGLNLTEGEVKAYIDFNGERKILNALDETYEETIISTKAQDYVITMGFEAKAKSSLYLMVGYDGDDPDGGVHENSPVNPPQVDTPEAQTRTVKGTGDPGNIIRVLDSEERVLGETTVIQQNVFTVTTNRDLRYNEKLKVVQVKGTLVSDPVEVIVNDTIPPEKPIINDVELSDKIVSGTAERFSTIEVRDQKTDELLGTGQASEIEKVHFALQKEVHLKQQLKVVAIDAAGNRSPEAFCQVVDTIPPQAPDVNEIFDTDTHIKGNTHEENCEITVRIGQEIITGKSNEQGDFDIDMKKTFAAGTKMKVTSRDAAGNDSDPTEVIVGSRKQTEKPTVNQLGDRDQELTGKAEKNALIRFDINNAHYEEHADERGDFRITLNQRYPADTEGIVTATGISGIESEEVDVRVIDNTPPEKPTIRRIVDIDREVSGLSERDSHIYLTITNKLTNEVRTYEGDVDQEGDFLIPIETTFPAGSIVQCRAKDKAGNLSEEVFLKVLSNKKLDITLADITTQDLTAEGDTSRAYSTYKVQIFSRVYQGQADENGHFSFPLDHRYEANTPIVYWAVDEEDSESTQSTRAKVLPRTPTINGITAGQLEIFGTVDPEAEVTIKVNNGISGVTPSDKKGNFNFTLANPVKIGDYIRVTQEKNDVSSREAVIFVGT